MLVECNWYWVNRLHVGGLWQYVILSRVPDRYSWLPKSHTCNDSEVNRTSAAPEVSANLRRALRPEAWHETLRHAVVLWPYGIDCYSGDIRRVHSCLEAVAVNVTTVNWPMLISQKELMIQASISWGWKDGLWKYVSVRVQKSIMFPLLRKAEETTLSLAQLKARTRTVPDCRKEEIKCSPCFPYLVSFFSTWEHVWHTVDESWQGLKVWWLPTFVCEMG